MSVYVPSFTRLEDLDAIRELVAEIGAAELITTGADGYPQATLLPVIWGDGVVLAHMARANPHWTAIADGAPTLLVCSGAQAYVSPSWYASKAEHGKVVPTWNYVSVQIRGRARVHDDPSWLRAQVTALTDAHEHDRERPWAVTDAPERFVAAQLRGIVGVEVTVESVDAKAKLSQNRSEADRRGVIAGLRDEGSAGAGLVARAMGGDGAAGVATPLARGWDRSGA